MRTQAIKMAVALATIGALMLLTAGTALAAPGGEKGAPNMGLGIAVSNVIANAADKGANNADPGPGLGTHLAVGVIMFNNPAMDVCQPPFSDPPFSLCG